MSEIIQTIGRLRRAMPRNPDVIELCDWAERQAIAPRVAIEAPLARAIPDKTTKPRKTRAEIQRAYRLRKKAIAK
jgi:hypothetical protein